jgi:hypothetical protein
MGRGGGGAESDRGNSMTSAVLKAAYTSTIIAIIPELVAVNATKFMININAMLKLNGSAPVFYEGSLKQNVYIIVLYGAMMVHL